MTSLATAKLSRLLRRVGERIGGYEGRAREGELVELIKSIVLESRLQPVKIVNVVEQYTVDDVAIVYINNRSGKLEYVVAEPELDEDTARLLSKLYIENPNCWDLLCIEKSIASERKLREIFVQRPLAVQYYYRKIASGYGALYPIVRDPSVEEIAGSSGDERISVIHRKYSWYGWMDTNVVVSGDSVDRIVLSLARLAGKHVSIAHPVAEGLTPDGLRVSLTYSGEVSRKGSSFVIRKKPQAPYSITKLVDVNAISPLIAAYLWLVMELRGFVLITGGISSGKTTLLQALLTLIPPTRRVVSIEDTPEISGSTGYWDPLVERTISVGEGANIDMYSLLKFSLRRRADYLVVGEVRGVEARLLIQASRLGHGVLATMHAESAEYAIERLYSPPISIPKNLLSNVWCIVVMENARGNRRVREVYEVDERVRLQRLFSLSESNEHEPRDPEEVAENSVKLSRALDRESLVNELASRSAFLSKLVSGGVFDLEALSERLNEYYFEIAEREAVEPSA